VTFKEIILRWLFSPRSGAKRPLADNDLSWARPRLVDWLRLLASDYATQRRLWDKVGHPDEMALQFDEFFSLCPQLVEHQQMTPDELAALSKIDAEFGRMSGPAHEELWTLEAIQQDESWAAKELFDVNSGLNQRGLAAAAALAKETGWDVSYSLETDLDETIDNGGWQVHLCCPKCGGPFGRIDDPPWNAHCPRCRIVTLQPDEQGDGSE